MVMVFVLFILSAMFALAAMWAAWSKKGGIGQPDPGPARQSAIATDGPGNGGQSMAPLQMLELSNHAAEKVDAARRRRHAEYEIASGRYQQALSAREHEIDAWTRAKSVALSRREWRVAFKSWWQVRCAMNIPVPEAPVISLPGRDEVLWAAGQEGESRLDTFLGARLNGDWTLFAGYKNAKGEIDRILVGPEGVFAFEVKNVNGVIHCDGDTWWRDKRDRYGNLVERGVPIADNGGRGPSRQINETADALERFFGKRAVKVRVVRVVVFTHDRAVLGTMENIAVNIVTTLAGLDLERMIAQSSGCLDDGLCRQLVDLIRRDHEFHAGSSRGRRVPATTTPSFSLFP